MMQMSRFFIASVLACAALFGVAWQVGCCGRPTSVSAHSPQDSGWTGNSGRGSPRRVHRRHRERIQAPAEEQPRSSSDNKLADLGRLLWFDQLHSLGRDNTCGGCHSPANGMGDSQPMAIGVQSNGIVGPSRTGPRNQRRSPTIVNTALFPRLMWNNRFEALSGDPFDGSEGFSFPAPEGDERFSAAENRLHDVQHLLQAQAHIPPTELIEVGAFEGVCPGGCRSRASIPGCASSTSTAPACRCRCPTGGFRNEPIRQVALAALNANAEYRKRFGQVFKEVKRGALIDFFMFGKAIAEFEFTLVFADAPLDRFARGHQNAMTPTKSAARCCSSVRRLRVVPPRRRQLERNVQRLPRARPGGPAGLPAVRRQHRQLHFLRPSENEDFGREERSGDPGDRYKFRTSPLRNLAVQAGFFHNGAHAWISRMPCAST